MRASSAPLVLHFDSRFQLFLPTELTDAAEFKKILSRAMKNRAAKSITVVYGHSHKEKTSYHGGVDFVCVPGLAFYKCDPCFSIIEVGGKGARIA